MLTTKDLEELPNYLLSLYYNFEQDELKKLAETLNVKKLEQLLNLHINPDNIFKKIAKLNNKSKKEIEDIFKSSVKYSNELDKKIADALNKKLPPINEQLINAQVLQTQGLCSNITNSMGFMIDGKVTPLAKTYQKAADSAYLKVSSGMYDLNSAIDSVMKEICDKGLLFVEYESGYKMRVESALRNNIITGVNQTVSQITQTNAKDLGVDKFEVSAHIGARNIGDGWQNHEKWQGKIYTMAELKSICGLGAVDGLCGANCRHSYYMFIDGVSERTYTDEELANMKGKSFYYKDKFYSGTYEAEQKQRAIERNIRKLKRMEAAGFDVKEKLKKQFFEYIQFSKTAGLPTQYGRLKTYGKIDDINSTQLFKYKSKISQNIDIKNNELKLLLKEQKELEDYTYEGFMKVTHFDMIDKEVIISNINKVEGEQKIYYEKILKYKNNKELIEQKKKEINLLKEKKVSKSIKEATELDKFEEKIKKEFNLSIEEFKKELDKLKNDSDILKEISIFDYQNIDEYLKFKNEEDIIEKINFYKKYDNESKIKLHSKILKYSKMKKYNNELIEIQAKAQNKQLKEKMLLDFNKQISQLEEDIDVLQESLLDDKYYKKFSNIWKDDVSVKNDFVLKKDKIQDKLKYFNDKLDYLDDMEQFEKFANLKKDLKEFEKLGNEYQSKLNEIELLKKKIEQLNLEKLKIQNPEKYNELIDDVYSQTRKDKAMWAKTTEEADKKLREKSGEIWRNATKEEKLMAYTYTHSYSYMNEPLRNLRYIGGKYTQFSSLEKDIEYLTNIIDKSSYDFDAWYQRGVRGYFDVFSDLQFASVDEAQSLIGKIYTDGAFVSCGVSKGKGLGGNIIMNIFCPAGTKGLYAEPFSHYGNGAGKNWDGISKQSSFGQESEIILQRGYSYRITKVQKSNGRWYIDMEVILGSEKQDVSQGRVKFKK